MDKYKVFGKIVLSFIFDNEQGDYLIGPKKGEYLERDGNTVWLITPEGERHESITTANVIDFALKRKDIDEIQ